MPQINLMALEVLSSSIATLILTYVKLLPLNYVANRVS